METFDEFDHIVINVNDMLYSQHWYSTVLGEILGGCEIEPMAGLTTDELIHSKLMARKRAELQHTAGEMAAPHGGVKFGEALLPIFLNQEHVQEPPPEQLRGTPRIGLPVTPEQMDKAVEVLRRYKVPFEGPVSYPAPCPAECSIFFKDPSSNFFELSVARPSYRPQWLPSLYSTYTQNDGDCDCDGQRPVHFFKMMLEATDLDASERFYRDDFGLQAVGRDLWPDDGHSATFQTADGSFVVLVQKEQVPPDGPGVHRNFMVPPDDYYRIYDRLKERNWLRPNYMTEMGLRGEDEVTCSLFDPDRHRLQLTAWRGEYRLPAAQKGKIVAGRLEDFAVGSVTHFAEGKFYIVRTEQGVLALSQICTHRQGNVGWQAPRWQFVCPCHNRRYTPTGSPAAFEPDVPPLHGYAIELVDGQVVVDTDTSIPRSMEEANHVTQIPAATG